MATSKTLQLILQLRDEATKKMKGFSGAIKNNSAAIKNAGRNMTILGGAISGVALLAGSAAAELEATEAKYNTVFKGMTDTSDKFIADFKKLTPATTAEARSMASGIQDLLVPMGFVREEATALTGDTMHLVGALTNFNSATHSAEDVNTAFQAALTGSFESLKRLGIQVSKETVQQKAIEMGLAATKDEVTKQAEAQALLALAYEQSGDALDAYTEASLDTKTKIGLLKAQLVDFGAKIGTAFLPAVTSLVEKIKPLIERITAWIDANPELAGKIAIVVAAIGGLLVVLGPILIILPGLVAAFTVLGGVIGAISIPILIVIGVIAAFIAIGILLWKNWDKIKAFLIEAWEAIKNVAVSVFTAIKDFIVNTFNFVKEFIISVFTAVKDFYVTIWTAIFEFFKTILTTIKDFIVTTFTAITNLVMTVWTSIKDFILGILTGIKDTIMNIWNTIVSFLGGIFDTIKGFVVEKWTAIKDTAIEIVMNMITGIKDAFLGMVDQAKNWGSNLIQGIVDGIRDKIDAVKQAAKDAVNAAKSFIGFGSPAKEGPGRDIVKWGQGMMKGFIQGVERETSTLQAILGKTLTGSPVNVAGAGAVTTPAGGLGGGRSISVTVTGNTFMGTPKEFADQIEQSLQRRLQDSLKF